MLVPKADDADVHVPCIGMQTNIASAFATNPPNSEGMALMQKTCKGNENERNGAKLTVE